MLANFHKKQKFTYCFLWLKLVYKNSCLIKIIEFKIKQIQLDFVMLISKRGMFSIFKFYTLTTSKKHSYIITIARVSNSQYFFRARLKAFRSSKDISVYCMNP
jgi:hypothetical protein